VITGVLTEKQAYKAIDSQTIFLFGGTLALAKALEMTGAGKLVADQVLGLLGNNSSPVMLLVVVFALSVVMTNFMSNTATVAVLVPVSLSIAAGMGA
ncbi:SLC13 family permease, partial [Klebsiella pneumoniae]|uniref:SLC13 family permease n=1 Tax=Klebsiella pneumoniae TaxID=573 RepID=UPI00226F3CD0